MTLAERLREKDPLLAVELRPPRAELEQGLSMDSWMGMHRALSRLMRKDTAIFLTDNAVGAREEENLHHLGCNLDEDVSKDRLCPFLTAKHTLEYCLWYVDRATTAGHTALTVLGGDKHVGAPRCLPHAYLLRQKIRERHPTLALGGWANPYHNPAEQVGFLLDDEVTADFFLTQIVSHHDLDSVERFQAEAAARGLALPGVFGVFYYRSANPQTLATLARFMRVPAMEITRDFEKGRTADEICARTIRALRDIGIRHVYVSNFRPDDAPERLEAIGGLVGRA
jgi:5,10-methylenetetrahydrofolate reductase